jgi:multiple sugar transport system permease protein
MSFTDWNILSTPSWIGWGNYVKLFTEDPLFYKSLGVTMIYTVFAVPLGMACALALALALNQKIRGLAFFRSVFFLPTVLSGVAVAMLWQWLFNPEFGAINTVLRALHLPAPGWLGSEHWALPALILMSLWGVGGTAVLYLAGLQNIPSQLYEAASIDGAGPVRSFFHVTMPMLSPVLFLTLILGIIGSFQVFTQAFVMTNGGPDHATEFYALYLYRHAIEYLNMGYASAMAWILLVIVLLLTLVQFRASRYWVYYEED